MVSQTVSLVIVPISRELGWTDATKGVVMSGFFYGYFPCCAVGGYLALRFNRPTAQILLLPLLTMAALSAFLPTLLLKLPNTAAATGMFLVLIVMGMMQAMLNPALHRMISVWSPIAERSVSHNLIYSGQQSGQVIGREKQIGSSGDSLEPPGHLLTHPHTVCMHGVF
jgi:ACS family sodium-dependent inorganic phosphate cotransporter